MLEVTSVPVIVTIVYSILMVYRSIVKDENWIKIIPVIAANLGVLLGVLAFYFAPDIMPAKDLLSAVLVGLASGLAATGTNQIYKQFSKNKKDKSTPDDDSPAATDDTITDDTIYTEE